jgi:hypothetical protein
LGNLFSRMMYLLPFPSCSFITSSFSLCTSVCILPLQRFSFITIFSFGSQAFSLHKNFLYLEKIFLSFSFLLHP